MQTGLIGVSSPVAGGVRPIHRLATWALLPPASPGPARIPGRVDAASPSAARTAERSARPRSGTRWPGSPAPERHELSETVAQSLQDRERTLRREADERRAAEAQRRRLEEERAEAKRRAESEAKPGARGRGGSPSARVEGAGVRRRARRRARRHLRVGRAVRPPPARGGEPPAPRRCPPLTEGRRVDRGLREGPVTTTR